MAKKQKEKKGQCQALNIDGSRCTRKIASKRAKYCELHGKMQDKKKLYSMNPVSKERARKKFSSLNDKTQARDAMRRSSRVLDQANELYIRDPTRFDVKGIDDASAEAISRNKKIISSEMSRVANVRWKGHKKRNPKKPKEKKPKEKKPKEKKPKGKGKGKGKSKK